MDWPEISLIPLGIVGALLGLGVYLLAARRKGEYSALLAFEAMFQGFLLAGGIHLMYCVFKPAQLIELLDHEERVVHLNKFTVKLDSLHALEIFCSSVVLIFLGLRALWSTCKKPGH